MTFQDFGVRLDKHFASQQQQWKPREFGPAPAFEKLSMLPGFKQTGASQWEACCPAHKDQKPSLSIGIGIDGKILVDCKAGCSFEEITRAADISPKEMFPQNGNGHKPATPVRRIAATYDYTDAEGNISYQVVRYHPKNFRQ
jgi:hypothetical protein